MIVYLFNIVIAFAVISISANENLNPLSEGACRLKVQEAIALYKNQDHDNAFKVFLAALDSIQNRTPAVSLEDARLYQEALATYLNTSSQLSKEQTAVKILQAYIKILTEHPDYYQLGFITAAAYANINKYEEFFSRFFESYMQDPTHYMAYKGKAALSIKLLERARNVEAREEQRKKVIENVYAAAELQSSDISLYRVLIAYSSPEDKRRYVLHSLNKIIDNNMMTSRTDIGFFVEQAVDLHEWDLAQSFIDKARLWYQYSRVVDTAQQYLLDSRNSKQLLNEEKGKKPG
jgi:hypothetical protein